MSLPDFVPKEVVEFYEETIASWKENQGPWEAATRLVEDPRMKKIYTSLAKVLKLECEWRRLFDLAAWASIMDFDDVREERYEMKKAIAELVPLLEKLAAQIYTIENMGGACEPPPELTSLRNLLGSYENPVFHKRFATDLQRLYSTSSCWPTPAELLSVMATAAGNFSAAVAYDLALGVVSQKPSLFASYVRYLTAQINLFNRFGHPNGFSETLTISNARLFDIAAVALGEKHEPKLDKKTGFPVAYKEAADKARYIASILKIS